MSTLLLFSSGATRGKYVTYGNRKAIEQYRSSHIIALKLPMQPI